MKFMIRFLIELLMMLNKKKVDNDIYDMSKAFAVRVVNLYKYLVEQRHEYVMSKQVFRCGTSIGANVHESKNAQSRPDFLSKMNIALKEADESDYWLELLHDTSFIDDKQYESISQDIHAIIGVLTKIVKTTKNNP